MITLKLQGGLGNQMFIYTFAKQLSILGYDVQLDASLYNPKLGMTQHANIRNLEILDFNISIPIVNIPSGHFCTNKLKKIYLRLFSHQKILHEKDIKSFSKIPKNSYINGYFVKVQYAENVLLELLQDFTPKYQLSSVNQSWKEKIQAASNSVFVHIRRGDYLLPMHWEFVKLGQTYYNNAIKLINKNISSPTFFIFSNDIEWCKDNIKLLNGLSSENTYFVEGNHEGNALEELELMRSCQHGIMANSTFSWWAGFLLENPNKVCIFPTHYFYNPYRDIVNNLLPKLNQWYLIDPIWGGGNTQKHSDAIFL